MVITGCFILIKLIQLNVLIQQVNIIIIIKNFILIYILFNIKILIIFHVLGKRILLWAHLPRAEKDVENEIDSFDLVCR